MKGKNNLKKSNVKLLRHAFSTNAKSMDIVLIGISHKQNDKDTFKVNRQLPPEIVSFVNYLLKLTKLQLPTEIA